MVVRRDIDEVECVCLVRAKRVSLSLWELGDCRIEVSAGLSRTRDVRCIAAVELRGPREQRQFELHGRHRVVERLRSQWSNLADLKIASILHSFKGPFVSRIEPQPNQVGLL